MATIASAVITINDTPTLITTSLGGRDVTLLRNYGGSATLFLGGPDVTTETGFPVAQGEAVTIPEGPVEIYGIVSGGPPITVRVMG